MKVSIEMEVRTLSNFNIIYILIDEYSLTFFTVGTVRIFNHEILKITYI